MQQIPMAKEENTAKARPIYLRPHVRDRALELVFYCALVFHNSVVLGAAAPSQKVLSILERLGVFPTKSWFVRSLRSGQSLLQSSKQDPQRLANVDEQD